MWHSEDINTILKRLESRLSGLSSKEAEERIKKYGYNEIYIPKRFRRLKIFLRQFESILVWMLIISTVVSFAIGEVNDAIAIAVIVALNATLGFIQEYRAEKAVEALKRMAAPKARVLRDGKEVVVPAREVVPGDILLLQAGDKVPADIRLIESMNLRIDEAALTGESIPVEKDPRPLPPEVPIHERKNMAYMGTVVTYGRGKGVVVATGFDTVFGKLAYELQKEDREPTPLQKRLEHFGRVITAIVSILVVLVFIEELFEGLNVYEGFLTAISLAVSAVPEGLPAVLTITLALGVQRMARRNAIVRRLASVETLGNATVICTDKTGTLTRNEMTVKKIYVNGKFIRVTGSGYEPEGEFIDDNGVKIKPLGDSTLKKLLLIGLLCNDSKLVRKSTTWTITGDPTEGALVVTAVKAGLNQEETRETFPRINEIPFDSRRKRMSTLHVIEGKPVLYSKGAPEVLLNLCSHIEENGIVRPITDTDKKKILEAAKKMASEALRVLALAYRDFERTPTELKEEDERYLVFVGLVGMIDPPRPEVKAALKKAREAGIKVIMVTGDHKDTAVAIAKEIGLIDDPENVTVLTGSDLDKMDEEEFAEIVDKVHIFARVSPEHKLKIVKYLKRKGHIVAMTGDGVNDAPAVKHADIGIAMGIRGTDVTRDAADLILADDNFATIVAAIEEGRTIYENVRKFIRLLLSANWDEIAVVFVSALLDMPIPFTPAQILWINLLTDGFPALALGLDPPEPDIMKRPPRSPKEKIYEKMELFFLVSVILSLFAWVAPFWIALQLKDTLPEARTLAFTQAVIFELLLALNCRSEKHFVFGNLKILLANKSLLLAVLASLVLQLLVIYLPPLQYMFNTSPLTYLDWALVTVFACTAILLSPKFWDKPLLRSPRKK